MREDRLTRSRFTEGPPAPMSTYADRAVVRERLLAHLRDTGATTSTNATYATELDCASRAIQYALVRLEADGAIVVHPQRHSAEFPAARSIELVEVTA